MKEKEYDVVVIGAGAAGLMAAGVAAAAGRSTLLIEKMEKAGRKIRITGKGRCNLTNIKPREEFLAKIRGGREFFTPAFDAFDNQALVDFFKGENVQLTFERGGRIFPSSGRAWEIAEALTCWAEAEGVEITYHTRAVAVKTVAVKSGGEVAGKVIGLEIENKRGFSRNIEARNVIICTGGVSYPSTGSTGEGYALAHALGHRIEEVRPSLVPLVPGDEKWTALNGMHLKNVNVRLMANGELAGEEFGEMDFTSRGLEGAVILRLSRTAVDAIIDGGEVAVSIDLKPALDAETIRARIGREREELPPEATLGELLRKLMPKAMIAPFAGELGLSAETPLADVGENEVEGIISQLKNFVIPIGDYGTFEQAVVTAGGVGTEQVDPLTMGSRLVKGLYFAGEVLDIDADTGGYNLQVAFSTGHLAGQLKQK